MRLTKEAKAELEALEDRRGRLTPEQVVEAARDESSALHGCFEWDDSKAGERYRIDQARELIRTVRMEVVYEERTIRTVSYVHDPAKDKNEPGYQNLMRVTVRGSVEIMRAELKAICADIARAAGIAMARSADLPGMADKLEALRIKAVELADSLDG